MQTVFLNTLAISERTVQTAFKKSKNGMVEDDHRGKTKRNDEAMQQRKKDLCRHILSFPLVPSPYGRSSSNLLYLSLELTLSKMCSLYTEHCQHNQIEPLCYTTYWTVFQSMNISLHCPKKDRCETCERYQNLELQEKQEEAENFQLHRQKAEKIREIKQKLKQGNDKTKITAIFDLQKALPTPKSEVSLFYFSRKLSTYNFSISDLTNDEVICFVWNEAISGRGSNEISSCLFQILKKWDANGAQEIKLFSDACPGQNRDWKILGLFGAFVNLEAISIKKSITFFLNLGIVKTKAMQFTPLLIARQSRLKCLFQNSGIR